MAEKLEQPTATEKVHIQLGSARVVVDDIVLLRPLNVWLQPRVCHLQRMLMFCKRKDVGKTIKLPHTGGQVIVKLQIAGFAQMHMPVGE